MPISANVSNIVTNLSSLGRRLNSSMFIVLNRTGWSHSRRTPSPARLAMLLISATGRTPLPFVFALALAYFMPRFALTFRIKCGVPVFVCTSREYPCFVDRRLCSGCCPLSSVKRLLLANQSQTSYGAFLGRRNKSLYKWSRWPPWL